MRTVTDPDVAAGYAVDSSLGAVAAGDVRGGARPRPGRRGRGAARGRCRRAGPWSPQGARTGLAGGAVATEGCLVLNVEGLDTIEELDELERFAVVGPGVVNASLKAAAAAVGLAYPPDPASSASCTIGGNVATNAGGLCCVKYGVTADYVRGLRGRPARRSGDADRAPDGQGRRRVRPHRAVRGVRGAAGRRDVGRRAAGPGAGPAADGARDVRHLAGGRRGRRGAAGASGRGRR